MKTFPLVCLGGSAGGLDAYMRVLRHLPADTGAAVVVVNHITLMPTRLHQVLPRFSRMPVRLITEGMPVQPDHVYVIPANRELHTDGDAFQLRTIARPRGWPDVITVFLQSMTACWRGRLIAVIVSGYDGDGAAALGGVKAAGGITMAQRLDTATHPDMPQAAIDSGWVDLVLSPEDIGKAIARIAREP